MVQVFCLKQGIVLMQQWTDSLPEWRKKKLEQTDYLP